MKSSGFFQTIIKPLLIITLFSSCASTQKFASVSESNLKGAILQSLERRERDWTALRGEARVRWGRQKMGNVLVLVKRPLDFRFDRLSDFGYYLQQTVSRGGLFTVIWYGENRYFQGIGTSEQLGRFLSVRLTPMEVVPFLLGSVPLEEAEVYNLHPLKTRDHYLLKGERGEITVQKIDNDYLPKKFVALDLEGERVYSIEYDDESPETGFPHRILGKFDGKSCEIVFEEIELNPALPHGLFEIEVPEGATRLYD